MMKEEKIEHEEKETQSIQITKKHKCIQAIQ